MALTHGFDSNKTLVPLLLDATGRPLVSARLYNASDVAIQTDAAGDLIVAGKDGAGTARILRTDANGQPMISALDTGGSARQLRCSTSGDLIAGGRDAAANGYPLRTDNTGELSVQGHLLNKLFAYGLAVHQTIGTSALPAGASNYDATAPAAGKVHVITNVAMYYTGTVAGVQIQTQILSSGTGRPVFNQSPPVSTQIYDRQGYWVLSANDNIRLVVVGATLNDDAFLYLHGFEMDV